MRIAVTGRHGQVVRALMAAAAATGDEIIPLARPEFDLRQPDAIAAHLHELRPEVLINAAAYTAVDRAEEEPEQALRLNGEAPGILAAACAEIDIPILHLSTDYVFDGRSGRPYSESDAPGPSSVYGSTKLAGEQAVAERNDRHVILRTAWVYAEEGRNFVTTMLSLARTRDKVQVVSDQTGSPNYAPDIAQALLGVAHAVRKAQPGDPRFGLFHLTSSGSTTWAGFAKRIFEEAAAHGLATAHVEPISTAQYPTAARRPANSQLDATKLGTVYGIRLPTWQNGLRRCITGIAAASQREREEP